MLTGWLLTIALLPPWLVGAPLVWLARMGRPLCARHWLLVPFAGLFGIIAPLQTLAVFADVPLRVSTPWFWFAVALGWAVMLAYKSGRAGLRAIPVRVLALVLVAALGQSFGLFKGAEWYRGNLETDQFHYVEIAQFMMDEAQSTRWQDVGQRPWVVVPMTLKDDRLGQSALHGFAAVTAGRDAIDMYFPVQLLGAVLMVPAVFLLGPVCGINRTLTSLAALAAGLAPGITFIMGSCYLSHVLFVPVLVAFLATVVRYARYGGRESLLGAALAYAVGLSVYLEFAPLFIGVAGATLGTAWLVGRAGIGRVAALAGALVVATFANPAAAAPAKVLYEQRLAAGPEMTLNAPQWVWVSTCWVDNGTAVGQGRGPDPLPLVLVLTCFGLAAAGAGFLAVRRARLPAAAALCSLLVPPALLLVLKPTSTYMISKLIWTLTPILVVLMACAFQVATRAASGRARFVPLALFAALVILLAQQSWNEQQHLIRKHSPRTAHARMWNDPDLREVCNELRQLPSSDVVLSVSGEKPWLTSGAMYYSARHHRYWLNSPRRIWMFENVQLPIQQLMDCDKAPPEVVLVVQRDGAVPDATVVRVISENATYRVLVVKSFRGTGAPTVASR